MIDDRFDVSDVEILEVVQRPTLCACGVFQSTCVLPRGDGSVALCWGCAHDYTEHGAEPGELAERCDCAHDEIFPPDMLSRAAAARALRANPAIRRAARRRAS